MLGADGRYPTTWVRFQQAGRDPLWSFE